MATPAQAAAATVGAGSLAAAGAYGITQAVNGTEESTDTETSEEVIQNNEPQNPITFALSGNADLDNNYHGKILDITKRENLNQIVKDVSENIEWWKWAYKNKFSNREQSTQLDPIFQKVTSEYSDFLDTALNKACDAAYKAAKSEYKGNNKHIVSNIGAFCTKGTSKIDISEPRITFYGTTSISGYTNGLLGVTNNKSKLIKVKQEEERNFNDLWWDWAFNNGFNTANTVAPFNAVTSGYASDDSTTTALNQACNASYKKTYFELTDNNNALLNNIKKFCTKDKEQTQLELPAFNEPTTKHTLNSSNLQSAYSETKSLARKNGNNDKLIDPNNENNKEWWVWSFEKNFLTIDSTKKTSIPAPFDKVTSGFKKDGDTNNTALNTACKTAYNYKKGQLETAWTGTEKLIDLVKKVCSPSDKSSSLALPEGE